MLAAPEKADAMGSVVDEERIRRMQADAFQRLNYARSYIVDKRQAGNLSRECSDKIYNAAAKNAELHIVSTPLASVYYYFERNTRSWIFLERSRISASSTLYSVTFAPNSAVPQAQVIQY